MSAYLLSAQWKDLLTSHLEAVPRELFLEAVRVNPAAGYIGTPVKRDEANPYPKATPSLSQAAFQAMVAVSSAEQAAAASLVLRTYAQRGYQTSFLADRQTSGTDGSLPYVTLVAHRRCDTVGTLTVGVDSPAGLSVDETHERTINGLRAQGRHVCELVRLAVDRGRDSKHALAALFHLAYIVMRIVHKATDVVIEVNPRHADFYCKAFGFVVADGPNICPRVNAPAVLLRLELALLEDRLKAYCARQWGNAVGGLAESRSLAFA